MFQGSYIFMYSLIAVLLLGILFGGNSSDDDQAPQKLFPELQNGIEHIRRIQFDAGEDRSVSLLWQATGEVSTGTQHDGAQGAGEWLVSERWGYPADRAAVQAFLQQLVAAEKLEHKTRKPENFSLLGVEDAGLRVSINSLPLFWLGNRPSIRDGQYVRVSDESDAGDVWLVSGDFGEVSANPVEWLADVVIDIKPERLNRLMIKHDGSEWQASLGDVVQLDGVQADRLQDTGLADSLRQTLTDVRTIDVLPVDEIDFSNASLLRATLDNAGIVELRLVSQGGRYWMSLPGRQWAYQISKPTYDKIVLTATDFIQQIEMNNEL